MTSPARSALRVAHQPLVIAAAVALMVGASPLAHAQYFSSTGANSSYPVNLFPIDPSAPSLDFTGNTVDMKVMVHKIHYGPNLPSVKAGKPYQIIGFGQSVADYSDVTFPQDIRNCTTCHKDTQQVKSASHGVDVKA